MDSPIRRCTSCGNEYPATVEYFYRQADRRDGLRRDCKFCQQKAKKRGDESSSALQSQTAPKAIPLEQLADHRDRYVIDPPFQRDDSWTTRKKQQLIDSILRGRAIPSLTA